MPYIYYPGIYAHTEDYATEVAVNYQLCYLVDSANVSLERILSEYLRDYGFENIIQYYRFYVDHLLMCIGRINDYLVPKNGTSDFIAFNRKLYNFNEVDFPILSEKKPRNLVEHLGERNNITIANYGAVGGFNVLFLDSDKELKDSIANDKKFYPYILDLKSKRIAFSDNLNKPDGSIEYYTIELISLREELNELKRRIDGLRSFHNS